MSTPAIKISNLTIGYGSRHLTEGANASIAAGRLVALIGRNGAGKSTLLRAIAGLDKPIAGTIKLNGSNIATITPRLRARTVALVTTGRVLIPDMKVADVVAMGRAPYTDWIGHLTSADREVAARALELVGMTGYSDRPIDSLSDGEAQRVMIARAMAQDTPVILLDEPTSFLDMPNRYELCLLLRQLAHNQQKTILFSTHELDIALRMCDDVMLIDSPRIHCLSATDMAQSGLMERLFANSTVAFNPKTLSINLNE